MTLGNFDFTVLIQFLVALFNTFAALAEKLGFSIDLGQDDKDKTEEEGKDDAEG